MLNYLKYTFKATIINIIVALFSTFAILLCIYLFFCHEIENTIQLLNIMTVDTSKANTAVTYFDENHELRNYPEYGTQYANIEIPKIDIDLPVYYGSTLDVLKNGVGHSSKSYFPGEGGSIVYMGHNSKNVFRRFSELEIGDDITVKTSYGEYKYKIYDMQIINEKEKEKLPIQRNKEILMVFTCYPFNNIGYTTKRFVVYSQLEK